MTACYHSKVMVYPGNPELSIEAQERVMTAFRQAVAKLQEGQREELLIGLEFVLRLDPTFTPAVNLRRQLASGAQEIDLSAIIGQLQAPTPETIDELLIEAVESFDQRSFLDAKNKVETVLLELPGHRDARQLLAQIEDALKVENQVGQFLAQAREALDRGDPQEAANFVMMAQALDPHHSGIAPTLQEIYAKGGMPQQAAASPAPPNPADTVAFETSDSGPEKLAVPLDDRMSDAGAPAAEFMQVGADGISSDAVPPWENSAAVDFSAVEAPHSSAAEVSPHRQPSPGPTHSEIEPPAAEPPSVEDVAGLFLEEVEPEPPSVADDISDLFETDAAAAAVPRDDLPGEQQVLKLMRGGEAAFDSGDFLAAIDSWSRIYLIDPANVTVSPRIEEARQQLEEAERRIEHLMFEAQEASLTGETERALALVNEVLGLDPRHVQAAELRQSLAGPTDEAAEAASTIGEMPELDDELFDETAAPPAGELDDLALEWEQQEVRKILGLPIRTVGVIAGGVAAGGIVLWLILGLLLGTKDEAGGDVYALRAQAEELFRQGNVEQALKLVEEFRISEPADQEVIDRLVERYQRAIAPPTPTPIPVNLVAARALMERGLFVHAYLEAMDGLARFPEDSALTEIKREIEQAEPMLEVLYASLATSKYQTATGIARDLLERYPQQADIVEVFERSMFNAALAELRVYNLTGATGYLHELDERSPNDEVVDRMLEFVEKYKARPVDMQLQVFIGSIDPRRRRDLLAADRPEETTAASTATPTPNVGAGEETT
jgi:tetratricopeptide (TPR) repeat protein